MRVTIGLNYNHFEIKYKPIVLFAVLRMEDVLSSPLFLETLKDEISKSNELEGELSKWKTASAQEIFNQLLPITLYLNTYFTYSNVIGYGTPENSHIFINTRYLSKYSVDNQDDLMEIGSNLLHEHSHDCGFDHDFRDTVRRKNSISYLLNRSYERAYRKFYRIPEPVIETYTPWYVRLWRNLWN